MPPLRFSPPNYAFLAFALASVVVAFIPAFKQLYEIANLAPAYSYIVIIPALSAVLFWRLRGRLRGLPFTGSWYGLILVGAGLFLRIVGQFSTMSTVVRYAFLMVIYGLVLSLTGSAVFRRLLLPLCVLIFMVPLPMFLTDEISLKLQLMSSWVGVELIRLAGISVYLEGNIIDLGAYQLEVAEACSGLNYLFPLMILSFLIAYFFRGPLWKKVLIFFSSIPLTVLMNSLRIGVIGVTVEYWGPQMAEGMLHEFEGWLVFMASTGAVVLIALALAKIGPSRVSWNAAFALGPTGPEPVAGQPAARPAGPIFGVPQPFLIATVITALVGLLGLAAPEAAEVRPTRSEFVEFPARIGDWVGQRQPLERVYLDALQLDDYLLADYREPGLGPINFYVAYYESQRGLNRIHSPRNCLPGGGWAIEKMQRYTLPATAHLPQPLTVNRLIIGQGSEKQLVYYWFQERGRDLTDENVVKWYLFWDSVTRSRTDGALVRLVAPLGPGADEAHVDAKLQRFVALVEPQLNRYVPD